MCFSSKPKIPKVQPQAIVPPVPPPAPLIEDLKGVKFGGGDEDYEREEKTDRGRIDLDKEEEEEDRNKLTLAETRRNKSISKAFNKKSANGGL